jgi:hypothetical protein
MCPHTHTQETLYFLLWFFPVNSSNFHLTQYIFYLMEVCLFKVCVLREPYIQTDITTTNTRQNSSSHRQKIRTDKNDLDAEELQ